MATISSPGLGSGLDINGIVSKLMAVERQPMTKLVAREASYQAKISAYGTVKSAVAGLQSAAAKLASANTYNAMSAKSSDTDKLTASVSGTPAAGNYTINVTQLAKYHTLRTNGNYTATTNTFTTGTISISIGGGTAVDVTINGTNNTLAGIRDAINNANAGVTASIVSDGTYQRLLLTSKTIGSVGDITVNVTDSGSGGTFALNGLASGNLVQLQAADDAQLSVNGLSITRTSNTIGDAIDGVTLTLTATGSATVTVAKDTASVVSAFDAFVKAFNEAKKQIGSLSAYNTESQQAAVLTGDATLRNLNSTLNQLVFSSVSGLGNDIATLSDIGVRLQKDGTLALDTAKLTAALNDPDKKVKELMSQTTAGNKGVAVRFKDTLSTWVNSGGMFDSRVDGINATIKSLRSQYTTLERRMQDIEARYRAQFSALDATVASMSQTSQFLSQQLAGLAKLNASS